MSLSASLAVAPTDVVLGVAAGMVVVASETVEAAVNVASAEPDVVVTSDDAVTAAVLGVGAGD